MFQEAMRRMGRAPEEVDDGQQEAEINRGFGVLQRFQINQFEFDNGAGPNGGPSAAIYHFTSNVNHSCSPTVYLKPTKGFLPTVGAPLEEDGMIVARALVDLVAGDECTINYGPLELIEWNVEQRRAYTTE